MSAVFLNCNRNKRSLMLDLKQERDREALGTIVAQSDVVLHSIRSIRLLLRSIRCERVATKAFAFCTA